MDFVPICKVTGASLQHWAYSFQPLKGKKKKNNWQQS